MIIDLQRYWGEREIYYPGELAAKIIDSMQRDNWTLLRSKEGRNAEVSGLFELLDQVCFYWKWDKSKITLETGNFWTKHSEYNIKYVNYADLVLDNDISKVQHRQWNKEKTYGMFIGRTNVTRLHAIHRHKTFEFKDQGLTSFNQDIKQYIDRQYLLDYLCATNKRFSEAIDINPYSDIDKISPPPITKNHVAGPLWNNVYEKIAIEIVCETSEDDNCFAFTEKLLRPILYKRPFLLVAAPDTISSYYKNIKNIVNQLDVKNPDGTQCVDMFELKYFENVIPIEYDTYGGVHRVDFVFDILHELIRTNRINTILEDCRDDIEHNYSVVAKYINHYKLQKPYYDRSFTKSEWGLPIYAKYK